MPKLILCVIVLGRLPNCVFSAQKLVFTRAGLAEAEYFGHHPLQTAYLRCFLPLKLFLQALGFPKLSTSDIFLGRLLISVFSAPKLVFTGAGVAEAEYLCRRSWQTAYFRFLCPKLVFRGAGLAEAEYLCPRPWQTAYFRVLCPQICFYRCWACRS